MDNILYYPHINLPDNNWTNRAILYWDKVGTIIPQTYQRSKLFTTYTSNLLREGLIETVDPNDIWNIPNYEESLIKAILNGDQFVENCRKNFWHGKIEKIHFEKFHYRVFEKLIDLEVAKRDIQSEWFIVESNVAKLMMTFLATILAIEKGYQPTTDTNLNLNVSFNNATRKYLTEYYQEDYTMNTNVRSQILENVMPFPYEFDLNKIRAFKDKHYEELRNFRKHIEKIVFNISLIADSNLRQIAIRREINDINEQKDSLLCKMNEFNFNKIFFGGACGLLATATPMILDPSLIGFPALLYGLYSIYKESNQGKIESPIQFLALTKKHFSQYDHKPQQTGG
jgi:hypothetical protein